MVANTDFALSEHVPIVFIQTSDPDVYEPMLRETAKVNKIYCKRHGLEYQEYVGLKRGYFPWHACFNRIILLKELIDAAYAGWAFYVDADAYVFDLSFDIRRLVTEIGKPVIMAPGGLTGFYWDVNDGVFLIDLRDATARELVLAWHADFMNTPDEVLQTAATWNSIPSDQPRLQRLLREDERFGQCLGHAPREVLNDQRASFLRQVLRSNSPTFEERLAQVKTDTAVVLSDCLES